MAQPVGYAFQYLGSVRVSAGVTYTSASILTIFPTANVMKAKIDHIGETKAFVNEFIRVSINGYPMFHFEDGEDCFIITGQSFVFDKDFTAAIGKYTVVV